MILGNPYRRGSFRAAFVPAPSFLQSSFSRLSAFLGFSQPPRSERKAVGGVLVNATGEITGRARRAALSSWNVVACRIKATAFVPVVQVILDDVSGIVGSFTWINGQVLTQCLYFKLPARRELELAAAANESATQGEHAFTNSANRAVINSTIASTSQLSGGQLLPSRSQAPAPSPLGLLLLHGDDGVSHGYWDHDVQSAPRVLCPPNQWTSYFDASTVSGCTESRLATQASVSAWRYQSV